MEARGAGVGPSALTSESINFRFEIVTAFNLAGCGIDDEAVVMESWL